MYVIVGFFLAANNITLYALTADKPTDTGKQRDEEEEEEEAREREHTNCTNTPTIQYT